MAGKQKIKNKIEKSTKIFLSNLGTVTEDEKKNIDSMADRIAEVIMENNGSDSEIKVNIQIVEPNHEEVEEEEEESEPPPPLIDLAYEDDYRGPEEAESSPEEGKCTCGNEDMIQLATALVTAAKMKDTLATFEEHGKKIHIVMKELSCLIVHFTQAANELGLSHCAELKKNDLWDLILHGGDAKENDEPILYKLVQHMKGVMLLNKAAEQLCAALEENGLMKRVRKGDEIPDGYCPVPNSKDD